MVLLVVSLFAPALACDPPEWRLEVLWPAEDEVVAPDATPLAALTTELEVTMVLERAGSEPAGVAGKVVETVVGEESDLYGSITRFVPDEPLADGDYVMQVLAAEADYLETVAFRVSSVESSEAAGAVTGLTADWISVRVHGGSACGPDAFSSVDVGFERPGDVGSRTVARSVHLVDGPRGTVDPEPLMVSRPEIIGYGFMPATLTEDDRVCVAVRSWGTQPDHDVMSEVACTESEVSLPGVFGCSSAGTAPAGLLASFLGLLVVGVRRRV